ncbi:MAG: nucleotidyltransferase family protein [Clostridiales bacterium]|nr:nucleotidyltransferase family protein [Clostridiales bacterium]
MRTVGIIAEYNPFHGGHLYQIQEIRRRFDAKSVIIAMSGDFVQRGEPAIYDKYTRTETVLRAGADLVLELPVCFSTAGAEDFAAAGVSLFDHLGMVDGLCFGSEAGDLTALTMAADILLAEPSSLKEILQMSLRSGNSYPKAQAQALAAAFPALRNADPETTSGSVTTSVANTLCSSPNNILAIEYLKALRRRNSRITPLTIRRTGQDYHESRPDVEKGFPSALALRKAIASGDIDYFDYYNNLMFRPSEALKDTRLSADCCKQLQNLTPVFPDDITAILNAKLLSLSEKRIDFADFSDFSPELASRLSHHLLDFTSFHGRVEQLKTKSFTYARISRALLHLVLGITRDSVTLAKQMDYIPYIRILGFRRSSASLLTELKHSCSLPLITKTADARTCLDADGLKILEKDLFASHLYQSLVFAKCGKRMPNEYTKSVIVI